MITETDIKTITEKIVKLTHDNKTFDKQWEALGFDPRNIHKLLIAIWSAGTTEESRMAYCLQFGIELGKLMEWRESEDDSAA